MIFSIGDAMNFERKKYKGTKTKEGPWLSPVVLLSHGSFFIWRTAVDVKCDGTRFAPTLDPVLATGSELQFPTLAQTGSTSTACFGPRTASPDTSRNPRRRSSASRS